MAEYDISDAFAVIEDYLIDSMRRNMLRHIGEEQQEGINWSQWQAEMLSGLEAYKRANQKLFDSVYPTINKKIDSMIWQAYQTGQSEQEVAILAAIRNGYNRRRPTNPVNSEFFRLNQRKMNALVEETAKSMEKAEYAALRMATDQYRKVIFGAQVFYNSGAGTLWQAVDMASKNFLSAGLNCIEYSNGRRVNIASYAEMALRTANTRAYLHGEAAKREQYGIHTVIVNRHNAACPLCVQWQGRVFIDDVWGGGTAEEAKTRGYPLLSEAIAGGLYHPNCKDSHTTFFAGINHARPPTDNQKAEQVRRYRLQQEQRYNERNIRKYKRLYEGTTDEKRRAAYKKYLRKWQQRNQDLIDRNPKILRRDFPREKLRGTLKELGITPPPNPPGVRVICKQPEPRKDKTIIIEARNIDPTIQRDIETIKAKTRLVTERAKELQDQAHIARYNAGVADIKATIATRNANLFRERANTIQTRIQLRDKKVAQLQREAQAAVAEAKALRNTAEIKKIEAKANIVISQAKEKEAQAGIARYNAGVADVKAKIATRNANVARENIRAIQAKAKLRDRKVSQMHLEAKLAIADAKRLHNVAEIKKIEARAAKRRYMALLRMENGGRLNVNVNTYTARQVSASVKPSPNTKKIAATVVKQEPKTREQLLAEIAKQKWRQQVQPYQRSDIAKMFAQMDDKRLRFWAKYGNLIEGDLYYTGHGYQSRRRIYLNLAEVNPRSTVLGYHRANTRVFLHETGHLMDDVFKIHEHLPELESKLRNDFLNYVDKLLGTQKRFNGPMLRDEFNGIYKSLDHYHLFTEREKKMIEQQVKGTGKDTRHLRNGVSDLIGGLTKLEIDPGYHHPVDYWNSDRELLLDEAIAHMFEAYMNGGIKYDEFKKFFPESMRYFEEYFEKLM